MEEQIINRVSASNLITFDLEELYSPGERFLFDIKDLLLQQLILKEKDFRDFIKTHDWSQYTNKHIAITCTAGAIVPTWAYMLLTVALQPFAATIIFGTLQDLEQQLYQQKLNSIDWEQYRNAKIVVNGCSKVEVPISAYVDVTNHLRPIASSIMFGEACSTIPLFKSKK
jgi:hypothetical protein